MKPKGLINAPLEGEVLPPEAASPVFLKRGPFVASERSNKYVTAGSTVYEIVDIVCIDLPPVLWPHIEVLIGEQVISKDKWRFVRPKFGTSVTVRIMPHGKAGKNIFRAVLMIAVVVGLTLIAPGVGSALGIQMTTAAGALTAAGSAFTAAFVAVGSLVATLALNALIPPPGLASAAGNQRYTISNTSNQLLAYQPIPRVFGKVRVYPCVVGRPYSEVVGKDQYLRMLLMVGYGPIKVEDIRIGDTPFNAYEGSSYEVTEGGPDGWAGNAVLDLYTRAIRELPIDINLDDPGTSIIQTTNLNTQEISVDITFPSGLTYFKPKGGNSQTQVEFHVQYAVAGSNNWQNPDWADNPNGWNHSGGIFRPTDNTQDALTASARWKVPVGQYDVRITRNTPASDDAGGNGTHVFYSSWTVLRSVTTDAPVIQEGVCLIALRLKATKSLNGVPQTVNCIATSYLPTTADGTTWTYQLTRSPAWAFCDLYRRRGPDVIVEDSRIDIPGIIAWDQQCAIPDQNGEPTFCFDGSISGGSVQQAASQVAAIGRAAPTFKDGKFSVVMDMVQTVPVQHITPRNSWGYTGNIVFVDQPHCLRAQYLNEDKNYAADELLVYNDGYSSTNATKYEALDLTSGVTRLSQAHRDARYHMAVGILRPETHTVSMDIEALRCTRGDLVLLTHDVILVGLSYGRIKEVYLNAQNEVTGYAVDNDCPMIAGQSYSIRLRHSDNTTSITGVQNVVGFNSDVTLSSPIDPSVAGQVGDLFMFGETGKETAPCVVSMIARGDDLSCDVTMVPYSPAIFTSDTSPIPPYDSLITTPIPPGESAPPPPLVALRSDDTVTNVGTDGTVYFQIVIDITPSASGGVPVQQWEVQFQAGDGILWAAVGDTGLFPASTTSMAVPNVQVGSDYSVRARSVSAEGNSSSWTQVGNHTVIGKTVAPDQPTNPSVTPIFAGNIIKWTNPGDLDFSHVVVSGSKTNDYSTSTVLSATSDVVFAHTGLTPGDVWYYWIASVNTSNITASVLFAGEGAALGVVQVDPVAAQLVTDLNISNQNFLSISLRQDQQLALFNAMSYVNGQGVNAYVLNFQNEQLGVNSALESTVSLIGAKSSDGSTFILNGQVSLSGASQTLSQQISDLEASNGSVSSKVATLASVYLNSDGTAKSTYSLSVSAVGSNGTQVVTGFSANASSSGSSSFAILSSNFEIVDPSSGTPYTVFSITGGIVKMHNVEVDTLKVNTAIVPVRISDLSSTSGSFSGPQTTVYTSIPDPTVISALTETITMPVAGYIDVEAWAKLNLPSGNAPWRVALSINGQVLPESARGGNAPNDAVSMAGSLLVSAGTYTISFLFSGHTTVAISNKSMRGNGYPSTAAAS